MAPRRWVPVAVAVLALVASAPAGAQAPTRLSGRVVEAGTGRALAGAEVVWLDAREGRVARADTAGAWVLDVPVGAAARLRVRHPGHAYRDLEVRPDSAGLVVVTLDRLALALDAIVVTASRREQRLAEATVETTLIDAAALRRSGAPDLASVLTAQSGIQVDGGVPSGAGVQVRGFDSRRVLILLDGQPLVGRVNGNFDLSRLPVSFVERVEVVKGPQSTLYGSDALGGVINVITRRAEVRGWSAGLSSGAGSQGRMEGAADLLWRRNDLGVTLDGGARTLDLAPGVAGDDATYARRANGLATVVWDAAASTRTIASLLGVRESQRYRTGQLYRFADNTQWAGRLVAERTSTLGRFSASLHGTTFAHLSRASTLDAPVSEVGDRDRQALWQGELLWNAVAGRTAIDAGTQLRHEQIRADRVIDRRRDVSSAEPFVQATYSLGALSVVPGVRLTWSDQWGRFIAPRLAAMWRPRPELALRVSGGRGFRAPDFKELYLDFVNTAAGYAVAGNANLRPERSSSLSVSTEYAGRRVWGRAGAYATAYRDFIETSEPDLAGTYTYRNLDRGSLHGLELEVGASAGAWQVDAGADLLRTRDHASGTPLLGRARAVVRGSLSGPVLGTLRGTTTVAYTGRTPIDREVASGRLMERGGWARLDARLTQPLPSGLRWSLGVTNLLDRDLGASWPGFTGRQFVTSLEWRGGPVAR